MEPVAVPIPTKRVALAFQDVTGVHQGAMGGASKRPPLHPVETIFAKAGRQQVALVTALLILVEPVVAQAPRRHHSQLASQPEFVIGSIVPVHLPLPRLVLLDNGGMVQSV